MMSALPIFGRARVLLWQTGHVRGSKAVLWVILWVVGGCARSCSKPELPTLTPHRVTITQIVPAKGLDLSVELGVRNPNRVDLSARSLTAHVVVAQRYDLGSTTVTQAFTLPAEREVQLAVPLSLEWRDVGALASLALTNTDVPYTVDGVVTLGGDVLNVDVPFRLAGTISPIDLLRAGLPSLPLMQPAP
jgi:LEA14-like dessication related protein